MCLEISALDSCFRSVAFFDSSDSTRSRSEPIGRETLQHDVEKSRRIERKRRRARRKPEKYRLHISQSKMRSQVTSSERESRRLSSTEPDPFELSRSESRMSPTIKGTSQRAWSDMEKSPLAKTIYVYAKFFNGKICVVLHCVGEIC